MATIQVKNKGKRTHWRELGIGWVSGQAKNESQSGVLIRCYADDNETTPSVGLRLSHEEAVSLYSRLSRYLGSR